MSRSCDQSTGYSATQNDEEKDALATLLQKFESFETERSICDMRMRQKTRGASRDFTKYREATNYLSFSEIEREKKKRETNIHTATMSRILDNIHDYDDSSIQTRLQKQKIPGAVWSKARPTNAVIDTHLGPGCYDTDKFYKGRHAGADKSKTSVVYSEPEVLAQEARFQKMMREKHSSLNKSRPSMSTQRLSSSRSLCTQSSEDAFNWKLVLKSPPSVKFNTADRWQNELYKIESFRKTTGMLLSPDFDEATKKKIPITISRTSESRADDKLDWPFLWCKDIDLNVDYGPKMSVSTAVRNSPRNYSSSFRSNSPSGFHVPRPTTGYDIGPGSFPVERILTGVRVKDPHRKLPSYVDRRPRLPKPKVALPDRTGELPKFSDLSTTSTYSFSRAGASVESNRVLAEIKAKKISKIYPRFEKTRR
jgi:hypothetical protein